MRTSHERVRWTLPPTIMMLMLVVGCAVRDTSPTAASQPPNAALTAEARVQDLQIQLSTGGAPDTLVTLGDGVALAAAATDAAGRAVPGVAIRWASLDTATAEVSADGVLRVRRSGMVQLAATAGSTTRTRAFPAIVIDGAAVQDILDDPLVARLVTGLSPTVKGRVQAALAASAGALAASAAPTLRTLGASVAETLQDVDDPADRAIMAVLELYVQHLQRALTL